MPEEQKLFDDGGKGGGIRVPQKFDTGKEALTLETLKNLESQISAAIEKIRQLKEAKTALERRTRELEALVNQKNEEIVGLTGEKNSIRAQIEGLLEELQDLE
ncbi:MAG: cell division protein ZapB [Nitrospiraceae bacterium]|nr:cell division protein ZapB [Nitrospiraceae bacterium]